eukprot:3293863-Pyramimonas_sp.AAC.1
MSIHSVRGSIHSGWEEVNSLWEGVNSLWEGGVDSLWEGVNLLWECHVDVPPRIIVLTLHHHTRVSPSLAHHYSRGCPLRPTRDPSRSSWGEEGTRGGGVQGTSSSRP